MIGLPIIWLINLLVNWFIGKPANWMIGLPVNWLIDFLVCWGYCKSNFYFGLMKLKYFRKIIWIVLRSQFTLYFKVLFMNEEQHSLDTLKDIRSMMERSSRFVSLSGWSGVAAGLCALSGAWVASKYIYVSHPGNFRHSTSVAQYPSETLLLIKYLICDKLFQIAIVTFIAAFVSAFTFTYIKSKKQGIPLLGNTSLRLMFSVAIPMIVGGLFVFRLIELQIFGLIAPACLLFYGLALLNASKYTLEEIRWLGMLQLLLGVLNCWYIGYGLLFWSFGFGVLHIVYGILMWWKYEREPTQQV